MRETLHEVAALLIFAILSFGWSYMRDLYRAQRETRTHQQENTRRVEVIWRELGFAEWDGVDRRLNDRRVHAMTYDGPERRHKQRRKT